MERSVIARVGSSSRAADEARVAAWAVSVLSSDVAFTPTSPVRAEGNQPHVLERFIPKKPQVIVGPSWFERAEFSIGEKNTLDEIRVTELRNEHGDDVPPHGVGGSLRDVASGHGEYHWGSRADDESLGAVEALAKKVAGKALASGSSMHNGVFPRLLAWRLEISDRHPAMRLHVVLGTTTYLTWRLLNYQPSEGISSLVPRDQLLVGVPSGETSSRPSGTTAGGDYSTSIGAANLSVAVTLVTADGYIVLRRRSTKASFAAGCLETSANGNPEVEQSLLRPCDRDDRGMIDLIGAMEREMVEELGPVALRWRPRPSALMVADGEGEEGTLHLVFEAMTPFSFAEVESAFAGADPSDGWSESDGELVGVPVDPGSANGAIGFLDDQENQIRATSRVAAMICLGNMWGGRAPHQIDIERGQTDREVVIGGRDRAGS